MNLSVDLPLTLKGDNNCLCFVKKCHLWCFLSREMEFEIIKSHNSRWHDYCGEEHRAERLPTYFT